MIKQAADSTGRPREAVTLGIIGDPIGHTLSPLLHGIFGRRTGIEVTYTPYRVAAADLEAAVRGAYALGIRGLNVTVPHKSAVIPYLREVEPAAARIGAVNTLVAGEGGYRGCNTDVSGLKRALEQAGIRLAGARAVILGAGGAARAAAFLCAMEQAEEILILNRTPDKAQALADDVNAACGTDSARAVTLEAFIREKAGERRYLAIQCTSAGLAPHGDVSPVTDPAFFAGLSYAVDLIYRPYRTEFLRLAAAAGVPVMNGLAMLLYQGADAFALWNPGSRPGEEDLKIALRAITAATLQAPVICLAGFMGSGKTTVAGALAERLSYEVYDTDRLIAERAGRSIPEIFAQDGEEAFRQMETEVLARIPGAQDAGCLEDGGRHCGCPDPAGGVILSLGGGLPLREENRRILRDHACLTVYLRTRPETVAMRLKEDNSRPLLAGSTEEKTARISSLLAAREPVYASCADLTVDTDDRTPGEIAEAILEGLS